MQSQCEELQKMRRMGSRQVMKQEQNSLLTDPCSAVWETLGAIEEGKRNRKGRGVQQQFLSGNWKRCPGTVNHRTSQKGNSSAWSPAGLRHTPVI